MADSALAAFSKNIGSVWGALTSELVAECARRLECLAGASGSEAWLSGLHINQPASEELYRHPVHGFMLLAHTEHAGLYRSPHDHGRGWVIYAVQDGAIEMGDYARIETASGEVRLVKRGSTLVRAGQLRVYLPGDIHDTCCTTDSALLFRFTDRDLAIEDRQEHRVTRFTERDGFWTTMPA